MGPASSSPEHAGTSRHDGRPTVTPTVRTDRVRDADRPAPRAPPVCASVARGGLQICILCTHGDSTATMCVRGRRIVPAVVLLVTLPVPRYGAPRTERIKIQSGSSKDDGRVVGVYFFEKPIPSQLSQADLSSRETRWLAGSVERQSASPTILQPQPAVLTQSR